MSSPFTTIRSEGALLPPELLTRIADADKDLGGLAPTDYHLGESERLGEAISRSWNRLVGVWASFAPSLEGFTANDPGTGAVRERWLGPLFQELGFGRLQVAKAREIDGVDHPISHEWDQIPIHLVGAGVELDRRTKGVAGAARMSPHALIQDYLNRTESLWGIVSNGRELRVLRDNVSLTRQAYLAFDLEAMFSGDVYADFALLWLTCHESRFEPQEGGASGCWLERWTQAAQAQGTRALNTLREGVESAISTLGAGFVSHPANAVLREGLHSGELATADYYRELLRLIYRFIFLFVAEGRALLHPEGTPEDARSCYNDYYSTTRLRGIAERLRGGPHTDLWRSVVFVCSRLADEDGCPELGLPFLGSSLFSSEACPHLDHAELANRDLLSAIRALAFTQQHRALRAIDYRNMGSEELGSIYESLLELHPEVHHESGTFELVTTSGNERKTTGSYYTPTSLISALLDTALEPVLDDAARQSDPEASILGLKVLDPACGSGHFLVAAAHRIAKRLAAIRTDEPEPSPDAHRHALRDVISRCIFGIDVNPMATELCKVSLWMEAVEPGKPLSFLEHHVVCGNSLLGATPRLLAGGIPDEAFTTLEGDDKDSVASLKKRNREERKGQAALFGEPAPPDLVGPIAKRFADLEATPDDSPATVHAKRQAWEALEASDESARARLVADAWCSAFMIKKTKERPVITQGVLELLERHPRGGDPRLHGEINELAAHHRFLHPHLAFPQVFASSPAGEGRDNHTMGWFGGFDLVLGNPPWAALSPDVREFFSRYEPSVRAMKKDEQDALMSELLQDAEIARRWDAYRHDLLALVHFLKKSGRFVLYSPGNLGKGDFNIYRSFVELALQLARVEGFAAQVVPGALYSGANTSAIRHYLLDNCRLLSLLGFDNIEREWFDVGVNSICVYAARVGGRTDDFKVYFGIASPEEAVGVLERAIPVQAEAIRSQAPDTYAISEVRDVVDQTLVSRLYAAWPAFGDQSAEPPHRHILREVDMGNDRGLFNEAEGLPVYEGRMIDRYDYRAKTYRSGHGNSSQWDDRPFGDPLKRVHPQWYVERAKIPRKLGDRPWRYRIGYQNIADPAMERSFISTLIPPGVVCGDKVPTILFPEAEDWAYLPWLGVANSLVIDFIARKRLTSKTMTMTILDSFPFPRVGPGDQLVKRLAPLVLRMICTGPEMTAYWNSMVPFAWCEAVSDGETPPGFLTTEERERVEVEIEAIVAYHAYGLSKEELPLVLDSFDKLRERDERAHGEFRIKRLILERFAALSESDVSDRSTARRRDPAGVVAGPKGGAP